MEPLHFIDGDWKSGNPPLAGAMTHGLWMGSVVFDGARAFEGRTPDLDRHCQRAVASCTAMGMKPCVDAALIEALAREGAARFPANMALYIRPLFFAETGFVSADPESTRFCLTLFPAPMPSTDGISVCLARVRRPNPDMAPADAKAACLYPNSARGLRDASARGFQNAVVLDGLGNVAELLTANLFVVRDGVAATPIANGTFLAGITRRRIIELLRADGIAVEERVVTWREVLEADELFSTGNYGKVQPIARIEDRALEPGPVARRARSLYWDFALSTR